MEFKFCFSCFASHALRMSTSSSYSREFTEVKIASLFKVFASLFLLLSFLRMMPG
jgi:hypothetical protein